MSANPHRQTKFGAVMALTFFLLAWLVTSCGIFHRADDFLVDISGARLADTRAGEHVLLVYADPAIFRSADDRLSTLIESVQQYAPAQVGIATALSAEQLDRLSKSKSWRNVVWSAGARPIGSSSSAATTEIAAMPGDADGQDAVGQNYLRLWTDQQAIYRWHCAQVAGEGAMRDSLEARLATAQQGEAVRIPAGVFGIRFRGGAGSLPHLDQSEFLEQTAISELVSGRIVLIGQYEDPMLGIFTPTTRGAGRISRLELRGNILETILCQDDIVRAGHLTGLILLLLVTVLSSFCYRQISTDWMLHAAVAVLLFITTVAWLSLTLLSVQLPITAMCSLSLLSLAGAMNSRFRVLTDYFHQWKLLRRVNAKTARGHAYEESWAAIAASAWQIFDPQRLVLLELDTTTNRLRIRETIGCQESDIIERRRDPSRTPYRLAVEERGLIELPRRPFLQTVGAGSSALQLLVPIIDAQQLHGFMVMDVDPAAVGQGSGFDDRLMEFADQIAVFLTGVRERELARLLAGKSLHRHRYLPEWIAARSLHQYELDHRDYESVLVSELECSASAVAIYDVFGTLLTANPRMIDQLQQRDVAIAGTSCAEILAALTGRSEEDCRKWVQSCLIDDRSEEWLIAAREPDRAPNILFVGPLTPAAGNPGSAIANRYLSIELIDGGVYQDQRSGQEKTRATQAMILSEQVSRMQQIAGTFPTTPTADSEWKLANEILLAVHQCQEALESGWSDQSHVGLWDLTCPVKDLLSTQRSGKVTSATSLHQRIWCAAESATQPDTSSTT